MKISSRMLKFPLAAGLALAISVPAYAETPEEFFRGKTLKIVVSAGPGGGYDLYSRTLSQHLGKHVPGNPDFILQFMPGAGGAKAANYTYNVAPKDGSVLSNISNTLALIQLLKGGVRYDVAKFNYIGRVASMNSMLMVWHTAPATTLEEAKTTRIIFGNTGKGQAGDIHPLSMKNVLGFSEFQVVQGYKGSANINAAMEQGEVHARVGAWSSWKSKAGQWIDQKKIIPLIEHGIEKSPDNPGVPLIVDLARNEFDRKVLEFINSDAAVGRAFAAPPGVPADRIDALRTGFMATMKDPAFIADAKKRSMDLWPMSGARLQEIMENAGTASPEVIEAARKALEM